MTDLILGRVNLNVEFVKGQPSPVIEILASDGNTDGDILILKVLQRGQIWNKEKLETGKGR
jgi:hypothetical protein